MCVSITHTHTHAPLTLLWLIWLSALNLLWGGNDKCFSYNDIAMQWAHLITYNVFNDFLDGSSCEHKCEGNYSSEMTSWGDTRNLLEGEGGEGTGGKRGGRRGQGERGGEERGG